MKKLWELIRPNLRLVLGALVVIFVLALIITVIVKLSKPATATLNGHTFKLELAKTLEQKQKGLSGRKSLNKGSAMLFVFDQKGYYSFWMKDMQFPIDILFIDNGKIITEYKYVMPPALGKEPARIYQSKKPASKVLEVSSGLSEKYNIKEGDSVEFKNL